MQIKFWVFLQNFDFPSYFLIKKPYDISRIPKNNFIVKISKISTERVNSLIIF